MADSTSRSVDCSYLLFFLHDIFLIAAKNDFTDGPKLSEKFQVVWQRCRPIPDIQLTSVPSSLPFTNVPAVRESWEALVEREPFPSLARELWRQISLPFLLFPPLLTGPISVSPPGGDFSDPVTSSTLVRFGRSVCFALKILTKGVFVSRVSCKSSGVSTRSSHSASISHPCVSFSHNLSQKRAVSKSYILKTKRSTGTSPTPNIYESCSPTMTGTLPISPTLVTRQRRFCKRRTNSPRLSSWSGRARSARMTR
jgi:hypothetical protein